jgi:RIO-like serine/threonine protein kinase
VHEILANNKLAPKLHTVQELAGGWKMVVMERIEEASHWDRQSDSEKCQDYLKQVLQVLQQGNEKYVHGDLRAPNVLIAGGRLYVIDFEWAGKVDEARFPGIINRDIFKHVDGEAGQLITPKMDEKMVNYLLTGSYDIKK